MFYSLCWLYLLSNLIDCFIVKSNETVSDNKTDNETDYCCLEGSHRFPNIQIEDNDSQSEQSLKRSPRSYQQNRQNQEFLNKISSWQNQITTSTYSMDTVSSNQKQDTENVNTLTTLYAEYTTWTTVSTTEEISEINFVSTTEWIEPTESNTIKEDNSQPLFTTFQIVLASILLSILILIVFLYTSCIYYTTKYFFFKEFDRKKRRKQRLIYLEQYRPNQSRKEHLVDYSKSINAISEPKKPSFKVQRKSTLGTKSETTFLTETESEK